MAVSASFKPALSFPFLTRFYDPLAERFFGGLPLRETLIQALELKRGMQVLDLGCGPGRLALQVKERAPGIYMTGLDVDPQILEVARRNAQKRGVTIQWRSQDLTSLNLRRRYDRICSSMVFHHLTSEGKNQALASIRKLLASGGRFVLADFCQTENLVERLRFLAVQLFDGCKTTAPHCSGWLEKNLPRYFSKVQKIARIPTFLGPIGVFQVSAPKDRSCP